MFLTLVFLLGAGALIWPATFASGRPAIAWLLGAAMLGMGLTLTPADFRRVGERPAAVVLGVSLQYLIMPSAAYLLSRLLRLSDEGLLGMVLVGASPGGTASNVIVYLARADVALSVTLTAVSTLLAPLATPALTALLAGRVVEVPVWGLLLDVLKIVVGPVLAGLVLRHLLSSWVERILPALVPVTSFIIALIIAIIVGASHARLGEGLLAFAPAVVLHNSVGLAAGYGMARLFRQPRKIARTLAIEVGMQNSGLAVALASKFFGTAAALPGAIFSVWHNLSGATLAGWWSGHGEEPANVDGDNI